MGLHMPGAGIGFSVPLSGVNAPVLSRFNESLKNAAPEAKNAGGARKSEGADMREEITAAAEPKCDLIVAVLNQGYSEEFMSAAREAGAGGGTVINARGLTHERAVKFFGISVQDEKEIIIILSKREKMLPIMEAVSKSFGVAAKAQGIIFSLPAENITGITLR
jgi:nitrogen regulatory protein PII